MAKPLSPAQRTRLQAAADHVLKREGEKMDAGTIIAEMVGQHGATFKTAPQGNTLRCAGVSTSCTWSKDRGLLDGWKRGATIQLMATPGID